MRSEGEPWFVKPGNRSALEERRVELLQDAERRRSQGRSMAERVREQFDIEQSSARHAQAYAWLAAGQPASRSGSEPNPLPLFASPLADSPQGTVKDVQSPAERSA